MNNYLLLVASFFISILGTCLIISLSKKRHWLDKPNDRSSHVEATPTSGGVAFVLVFLVTSFISLQGSVAAFDYLIILFLSFSIAAMGLVDDIFQLGIGPRIFTQMIAVLTILALFGQPVFPFFSLAINLGWGGYFILAIGLIWFINLFNFMDGIDGLAAMQTLFICISLLIITSLEINDSIQIILPSLIACVAGFLLLNFPPAKIFMGDTGSYFLGFILCVLMLVTTTTSLSNVWVWLILASVFIVDASCTLFSRLFSGETWYYAHRTHAYQLVAHYFKSHRKVLFIVLAINCCFLLPLAWLAQHQPEWGAMLTIIAWVPLIILVNIIRKSSALRV